MNHFEHLQRTTDYIEDNLKEPISINDCAQVEGFSNFHFHRLFGLFVGYSVMEYIRKDGCISRFSIPSKPVLTEILDSFHGGFLMDYLGEVRMEQLNGMTVASAARVSNNPEDEVVTYLTEWAGETGIGSSRRFGFDIPVPEEEQNRGLRGYEYWVALDTIVPAPEDVTIKKVEECKYATLRITDPFVDPFERIPMGWKKLAGWVNGKGYEPSCTKERYWLEEVLEIDGLTVMDIYFPIE